MSIPTDDTKLPFRAVSALPSIFIPRMNKTDATMYAKFTAIARFAEPAPEENGIMSCMAICPPSF